MTDILHIDFETQSPVDIKTEGVYKYMAHPDTKPLFCSYKINDGIIKRWNNKDLCPFDIIMHVKNGGIIKAHNAGFERLLWQTILTPRYSWPTARLEQFICTAATAAAMALPRDLAGLGDALGLAAKKDSYGKTLIRKFSVPRKARKDEDPSLTYFNTPSDFPEDWILFEKYCDMDVESEYAADKRMVALSAYDMQRYYQSERINDRGIRVDIASVNAALLLADKAKNILDKEISAVTSGQVTSCSQVARLTNWIEQQGVPVKSLGKADIEELLEFEDIPENVKTALKLRQEAAKTSVSKLQAFKDRAGSDSRIRGAFLFRAAGTGRYSSTGAQLHNMPRPRKVFANAKLDSSILFSAFKLADPTYLKTLYGEELGKTLWLISDAVRGFIFASPGHELVVADYAGIEGAVAAWLADERWKIDALFDIMRDPKLPDLYRRTAAGIYGTTTNIITKKDSRRQVGKVAELALQYQGGVSAFHSMAKNYGLDLDDAFKPVWFAADEEKQERAEKRYEECCARGEASTKILSRQAWLAAELIKVGYRATNPAIVAAWSLLEDAIMQAVTEKGAVISVLRIKFVVRFGYLICKLPSDRCLFYGAPKISDVEPPWADKTQPPEKREKKKTVTVCGSVQVSKTKGVRMRYALYGGLAFENIVQAIALDLLENGIEKAEAAGYPVIGHVHDEILTEVPRGFGSVDEFEKLICELPEWAQGLPLAASGWRGKRYRKD